MHLRAKCRRGLLENCDDPDVNLLCHQLNEVLNIDESTNSSTPSLPGSSKGGTKPCLGSGCKTCILVIETDRVMGVNGEIVKVEGNFTCRSKRVIYYIHCNKCPQAYVGKTTQKLQDRMSQHCRDIRQRNTRSSVANHFNLPGHTIEDLGVCLIARFHSRTSDAKIKEEEKRLMIILGTIEPEGMNKG